MSELWYLVHMKIQRVYIDTSIIGGCFDTEFAAASNRLMHDFRTNRLKAVVSDLVAIEISRGFAEIQEQFRQLLTWEHEWLDTTGEAVVLADAYQAQNILTPKYYDDGLHIAMATISEVDVLVSWNFRHIVNFHRIRLFNSINLSLGYKAV